MEPDPPIYVETVAVVGVDPLAFLVVVFMVSLDGTVEPTEVPYVKGDSLWAS